MEEALYSARPQTASGGWLDKKCYWCGEYFKKDEKLMLIIIHYEYKKIYKSLGSNVIMHLEEFEELVRECNGNHKEIVIALGIHKKKRVSNVITDEQKKNIEAFKQACKKYGFYIDTTTKSEIHMRKSGTSLTMEYNYRTNRINISDKIRKHGLMDGLFKHDICAKVYNSMQEILGTGLRDEFTAAGTIQKATESVNKMFGN